MVELLNLSFLRTEGLDIDLSDDDGSSSISLEIADNIFQRINENKVIFVLKTGEKWVIDTNYFTGVPGKPELIIENEEKDENGMLIKVDIRLNNSYYPGTKVRADFECTVKRICNGNHILQLNFFNKDFCEISLEDWLTNRETASSTINFNTEIFEFNNSTFFNSTRKKVRVEFFPNWSINLIGDEIAEFCHICYRHPYPYGDYVIADKIRIELPNSTAKSLFLNPSAKRTKIFINPTQEQSWNFDKYLSLKKGWSVDLPMPMENLFDQIYVEIDVNQEEKASYVLLARPDKQKKDCSLKFINYERKNHLLIPFQKLYYILGFDGDTLQRLIIGKLSSDGGWCHSNGCSVLLGDGPSAKLVEFEFFDFKLIRSIIEPAVLAISAPLKDVITEIKLSGTLKSVIFTECPNYRVQQNLQGQIRIDLKHNCSAPIICIPENLRISVIRPIDLLVLQFEFINLTFMSGGQQGKVPLLIRTNMKEPSYLIAHFPPQHIAEEVFINEPFAQSKSRLSEPSRLVFKLPVKSNSILYSLEVLLDWKNFEQSVSPKAITFKENNSPDFLTSNPCNDTPNMEPPSIEHTAIEIPYRLVISPNSSAGWAHNLLPIANKGITELWHTRLGIRDGTNIDEKDNSQRTIRAIWSRIGDKQNPFPLSLEPHHRNTIVKQTAVQTSANSSSYLPIPVNVKQLMLSSLGAWMDVQGDWYPDNCGISSWQHQTVMGRDTFVKVVEEGYLFPLCNRASLIQVTERKFHTENNETIAYLFKRYFVIVRDLEIDYTSTNISNIERKNPIHKIRFLTRITPNLTMDSNCDRDGNGVPENCDYFEIKVNNQPFPFHIIAQDCNGVDTEISMPQAFVTQAFVDGDGLDNLVSGYNQDVEMGGQKISYAKSINEGDTSFKTKSFTFGAAALPKSAINQHPSRFYPIMKQADVRIETVEQIVGSLGQPIKIKMNSTYLDCGFHEVNNAGEIFVDLVDKVNLNFPVNKSGGLTSPNMDMTAVSRFLGPIGGPVDDLKRKAEGIFNPEEFFNQNAKILGSILLEKIIEEVDFKQPDVPKIRFPQLKSQPIFPNGNTNVPPIAIETRMNWKPKLKSYEIFQVENNQSSLNVDVKIYTDLVTPPNSSYEITGELKNFKVVLAPEEENQFLILYFHQLIFKTSTGQKPVIIPEINKIEFKGALKFIQVMTEKMKDIANNPGIDISPSGILVNKTVSIPDLNIGGTISIQKVSLINQLYLPFNNNPLRFRFSFSTRENPFLIKVGAYGGGGFLGIALGVDGVEFLEAALEFGGVEALKIGPATGDVHLMAGIYYRKGKVEKEKGKEYDTCELTGYVRCGGALKVLGVTVSAEFYLGLNYDFNKDRVWGVATLTVKIDFHFFSKRVKLHCEHEFKGGGSPLLKQHDALEESQWIEYCEAFA